MDNEEKRSDRVPEMTCKRGLRCLLTFSMALAFSFLSPLFFELLTSPAQTPTCCFVKHCLESFFMKLVPSRRMHGKLRSPLLSVVLAPALAEISCDSTSALRESRMNLHPQDPTLSDRQPNSISLSRKSFFFGAVFHSPHRDPSGDPSGDSSFRLTLLFLFLRPILRISFRTPRICPGTLIRLYPCTRMIPFLRRSQRYGILIAAIAHSVLPSSRTRPGPSYSVRQTCLGCQRRNKSSFRSFRLSGSCP